MKKVLYVSNIEVPYRTEFFNQLSEKCDLTVLYERKKSKNRDSKWASSLKSEFKVFYLKGINIKNEYCFNPLILKYVFSKKYDKVIIGCYNSPSQIIAILFMRLFHKKYILNLDGEYFIDGNGIKQKVKRFLLKGASDYMIAGEKSAINLSKYFDSKIIHPYYFSSLTAKELINNSNKFNKNQNDNVIVVGQYFDYKGLDIALKVAALDENIHYKFIGSGVRSDLLQNEVERMKLSNVEVIPFLDKKKLYKEYQNCLCLLLTSKRECWGLVVNEAASFGCPIIATYGSGAAIEFLCDEFTKYLSNNVQDIYNLVNGLVDNDGLKKYKKYLIEKSKNYSIEKSVEAYMEVIDER